VIVEIPWFNKVLNPNNRAHWSIVAKARKKQRSDAYFLAYGNTLEKADSYPLEITFHPPDKRPRDRDNCLAAIKSALDGIADAWGVDDKNFHFPNPDFGKVVKNGKIIIELRST